MSLLHSSLRWATLWIGSHISLLFCELLPPLWYYHFFLAGYLLQDLVPKLELPTMIYGLPKLIRHSQFSLCITKSCRKREWTLPSSPSLYFLAISQLFSSQAMVALEISGILLLINFQAEKGSQQFTCQITCKSQGRAFCPSLLLPLPPPNRGEEQGESLISP